MWLLGNLLKQRGVCDLQAVRLRRFLSILSFFVPLAIGGLPIWAEKFEVGQIFQALMLKKCG